MLQDNFKELVWSEIVQAELRQLFSAVPFLGWGPIGYVISVIALKWAERLYKQFCTTVNVQMIELRNEAQENVYATASAELNIIAAQKGIESNEFKAARELHKRAFADFVRLSK